MFFKRWLLLASHGSAVSWLSFEFLISVVPSCQKGFYYFILRCPGSIACRATYGIWKTNPQETHGVSLGATSIPGTARGPGCVCIIMKTATHTPHVLFVPSEAKRRHWNTPRGIQSHSPFPHSHIRGSKGAVFICCHSLCRLCFCRPAQNWLGGGATYFFSCPSTKAEGIIAGQRDCSLHFAMTTFLTGHKHPAAALRNY